MPNDTISVTAWPHGLTRVPFWVYQDKDLLQTEQQRVFEGAVWNYLCLESEIPNPGERVRGDGKVAPTSCSGSGESYRG